MSISETSYDEDMNPFLESTKQRGLKFQSQGHRESDQLLHTNRPPEKKHSFPWPNRRFMLHMLLVAASISLMLFGWLQQTTRVVVWGDSLVKFAENIPTAQHEVFHYGFLDKLAHHLKPHYPNSMALYIRNAGLEAQTIHRLRQRIWWQVDVWFPDAVVMLWESDVSERWEEDMTPQEVSTRHADYITDFDAVLSHLKHFTRAPYILVTGPILLGEKPRGTNKRSTPNNHNGTLGVDAIQDQYVDMTSKECARHGVEYLDARSAFFAAEPDGWKEASGWFTVGGGHLSERGIDLLISLISDRFRRRPSEKSWFCGGVVRRIGLRCPDFGSFVIGYISNQELSTASV
jgi:hypothetical protein